MSTFNYFSLSVDHGLRGNIGKLPVFKTYQGEPHHAEMMLFLIPNGDQSSQDEKSAQIVNVHFPVEMFVKVRELRVGDYVRIHFERVDLSKGMNHKTGKEESYIIVKAIRVELIRPAIRRSAQQPTTSKRSLPIFPERKGNGLYKECSR